MNTTRFSVAALLLAFGLASPFAHAGMMEKDKGMMDGEMTGMLMGAKDHHASGTVALAKDGTGHPVLRLENLKVDKVPDGRVYLAKKAATTPRALSWAS